MDPFDDFEFKPLTEGLGSHKKAEKIKSDVKSTGLAKEKVARSVPDVPPRSMLATSDTSFDMPTLQSSPKEPPRKASQSISDLINSLPPSLDFDESPKPSAPKAPTSASKGASIFDAASVPVMPNIGTTDPYSDRPQIFQPLAREEYKPATGPTIGQVLPSTLTKKPTPPTPGLGATPGTPGMSAPTSTVAPPMPGMPAAGSVAAASASASTSVTNASAATPASPYRERLDESFARAFPHASSTVERPKRDLGAEDSLERLQPIAGNLVSGLLDGMVCTGVSMILLVSILLITNVNLVGLLGNAQTDGPTQIHLFLLFVAVLEMYMLVARSFFGATLGEWAFDIQLGTDEDQKRTIYPIQVAWRQILVTITGFLLLPLLSIVFRKDLARFLTGLQLYRRP